MHFFPSLPALIEAQKPEALLVDLWGVIHDGVALYPGVIEALAYLQKKQIPVIFLSNAPRRARVAAAGLMRLGVLRDLYTDILTSGEATYAYFAKNTPWGRDYMYIGPEKDRVLLDGLSYNPVMTAEAAQFVVCTGFDQDDSTLAEKLPQLEASLARKLPMVCANPDMEVVRLDGTRALCAGVLAEWYAGQGGEVLYFGKPYPNIYEMALQNWNLKAENILAIGDNLDTDIKGANTAGIRSVLVTGGVLNARLQQGETVEGICKENGNKPGFLVPGFC